MNSKPFVLSSIVPRVCLALLCLLLALGVQGTVHAAIYAHYSFDADYSDSSGNGRDGTLVEGLGIPTTTSGGAPAGTPGDSYVTNGISQYKFGGGSMHFSTDRDFVSLPLTAFANGTPWSIALWVKIAAQETNEPATAKTFDMAMGNVNDNNNFIAVAQGSASRWRNTGNSFSQDFVSTGLGTNVWVHVAFVADGGGGFKVYTNGALSVSATGKNTAFSYNAIGEAYSVNTTANDFDFHGEIDEVWVYDQALNALQVTNLFTLNEANPTADNDGDGMPNYWEDANGFNKNSLADAALDADGDGLANLQEFLHNTNPHNPDTDGDGLTDGQEVNGTLNTWNGSTAGAAPGDPTDPNLVDSDGDGVADGVEVITYQSNPNAVDTDGDGMPDGYEALCGIKLLVNDANLDKDGDSLSNIQEYDPAQGPNTSSPRTRADLVDTDGDGYSDLVENNTGSWGGVTATGTNPNKADTDNDGLPDGKENPDLAANNPPTQYKIDPNVADTDGDGLSDGWEVNTTQTDPSLADGDGDGYYDLVELMNGSNPNSGASIPASLDILAWTDFSHLPWLTLNAGTSPSGTLSLYPGGGTNLLISTNLGNVGVEVGFANPGIPVFCSVDFRMDGTPQNDFNIVTINNLFPNSIQTFNWNHCTMRVNADGSVVSNYGGTGTNIAVAGTIKVGRVYTAQYAYDIPNNLFGIDIYDITGGGTNILHVDPQPTRNSAPAGTLYFAVGTQNSVTTGNPVRFDNLIVSTNVIPLPSIQVLQSLQRTATQFRATYNRFNTNVVFKLMRSANLTDGFPTVVDGPRKPSGTNDVFVDPSPLADKAFYKLVDVP